MASEVTWKKVIESGEGTVPAAPMESVSWTRGPGEGEDHWRPLVRERLLELARSRMKGEEGPVEVLETLVEEWAANDPRAGESLLELLSEARTTLYAGEADLLPAGESAVMDRVLLELKALALEACLRGRERRERELAEKWRAMEGFPDTLAATVDPRTLARAGVERLKGLLGLERAVLLEAVHAKRLAPLAGDAEGLGRVMELSGKAGDDFFLQARTLTACRLEEECGWNLGQGWGGAVLVPLVVRRRVTGGLLLKTGGGAGPVGRGLLDLETVERFALRLAEALENARLHAREQRKIKETLALLEIARVVSSTLDLEEILERVAGMVVEVCPVVLCTAYLRENGGFRLRACTGFIEEGYRKREKGKVIYLEELGMEVSRTLEKGEYGVLPASRTDRLLPRETLEEHGVEEVLLQPLSARGRTVGFLALFHAGSLDPMEAWEERQLVQAVAAQASLAVENASLYADIERGYFSTVQALAKAIEVKDPYTRGHSERVTTYALMIAEAMGLDEREKQKLKYAATLHDIGKIGIAGRVLNKPGALTEEEYTHVKTHPILGDSIVEPVEFLQEPRPIILHHHERYDGKGYPDGLKGEDIPLSARILSVADAFEAMRSDRPYRKALPLEEARRELVRNAGTQFDPRVVEVFLELLDRHGGDPIPRDDSVGGARDGVGGGKEEKIGASPGGDDAGR